MTRWARVLVLAGVSVLSSGCGIADPDLQEEGVVEFVDVEGGCWVIQTATDRLEPVNLRAEFSVDGLRVVFQARPRPDLFSVCQVGRLVELITIERAP